MEGREQIEEFEKLKTVEELAVESKKIEVTENQYKVMSNKYLQGDSIELWLRRIARNLALIDLLYEKEISEEKIFEILSNFEFLPNSPCLANAGRELQSLHACYVIPIGDSMEEIYGAVTAMGLINQSGGGTGF